MTFVYSYFIRQTGAVLCIGTLAWDYCRDNSTIEEFSNWALFLHFLYFQLPLKSRALAFIHPTSFIGANLIPAMYIYLLLWKPSLEVDHMELWDVNWSTVVTRSVLINFTPLVFHSLDITTNQSNLINSYKTKAKKPMYIWSIISFPIIGFIYEFTYPESEDIKDLEDTNIFLKWNKVIALIALLFSFSILYFLIFKRSYENNRIKNK